MAPTNAQLTEENERLTARVAELESRAANGRQRPLPDRPSFGMSEGEREEIERTGKAVSPFDGVVRTADDLPEGVTVDDRLRQREDVGPLVDVSKTPAAQQDA